jgi:hypothetical protein
MGGGRDGWMDGPTRESRYMGLNNVGVSLVFIQVSVQYRYGSGPFKINLVRIDMKNGDRIIKTRKIFLY